jgi:hypothetical protein
MKNLWFRKRDPEYDGNPGLGIEWTLCREIPYFTIDKPDKDYHDYIVITLKLVTYLLSIDIYYRKLPYRNMAEHRAFRKAERSQIHNNN